MSENAFYLGEQITGDLTDFMNRANAKLGREAVQSVGSDGFITGFNITEDEMRILREVNHKIDMLDSIDPAKLRKLTIAQLNAQIDALTSLADTKTVLKVYGRVLLWLVKREINELGSL